MNIDAHKKWFEDYVADKMKQAKGDAEPMRIKLVHSGNVLANAEGIAREEAFGPDLARACALAALYHDISRFDQYLLYNTFKDKDSRNHGAWSVQIVKREKRLADEPNDRRLLVQTAICMHNRLAVPKAVSGAALPACRAVRDSDKLDIIRVMDEHLSAQKPYNPTVVLGLPDDPDLASAQAIKDAMSGRSASYGDLLSVNDFRLLLGTWLFSMNFASSRKMFKKAGHAERIVAALPANGVYGQAREKILKELRKED